jgi:predicted HD superfamily hydrolase involved in NAD metabolism
MQGIPDNLSLEQARKWVLARVSAKRMRHIEGVVKASLRIARAYGCDQYLAQLAGWLHDACKGLSADELIEQARDYRIPLTAVEEAQGNLLHGPVAACLVKRELGIENEELLAAIAEHTLGNAPMSKLSEVLYLADWLEENRPAVYAQPIWQALSIESKIDVDRAIVKATDLSLEHLIATGRPIHPRAIEVRNYYLARLKSRSCSVEK